jgi:hypothetical protein
VTSLARPLPSIRTDATGWPWDEEPAPLQALTSNGSSWPTIAIVTPSFNQAQFIEETMRSVLLQNYPRLEYVVMDGGSTDGSAAIIATYEPWLTHWTSAPDRGQSDAINRGFARVPDATIYGWLNSDDVLLPGALAAVGEFFASNPSCEWLSGDGIFVYEPDLRTHYEKKSAPYTTRELLQYGRGMYLPQPSVFFAQKLYRRVGGIDCSLRYSMDLDLWLRLSRHAPLHHLPRFLSMLRQHPAAKTNQDNGAAMSEIEAVVRRHARGLLGPAQLFRAVASIRKERAENLCTMALDAYFSSDRTSAWQALARAGAMYPPVVCSRRAAGVFLRLTLPEQIKGAMFVRP